MSQLKDYEFSAIHRQILADPRYQRNILYGEPRPGHAEGSVAAHIAELKENLNTLCKFPQISLEYYWKLQILIQVHDAFKAETAAKGKKNCAIEDPDSHASLARVYLSQFTDDQDLLSIVQYHDLGYAIYRNFKTKGYINEARLVAGLETIKDLNLYLLFCICDSCTASKGREMIAWFVDEINRRYPGVWVNKGHMIPGAAVTTEGAW